MGIVFQNSSPFNWAFFNELQMAYMFWFQGYKLSDACDLLLVIFYLIPFVLHKQKLCVDNAFPKIIVKDPCLHAWQVFK
jgi:hypothetical protein